VTSGPSVTVLVVSYNHAKYIRQCLTSIANQTLQPRRVLVYDDASYDNTVAVAREFVSSNGLDFEIVTNSVNRGLCATLNTALRIVRTEYYTYISADDLMLPERLSVQYQQMSDVARDVALSYSDAYRIDEHSQRLPKLFSERLEWSALSDLDGSLFRSLSQRNWIPAPSVMLRTDSVRRVGGYDESLFFEDHDLWLRLARHYRFVHIAEPLVEFRELASSLGHVEFHEDNPKFLEAYARMLAKHFDDSTSAESVGPRAWSFAYRLWRTGDVSKQNARTMALSSRFAPRPTRAYVYSVLARLGVGGQLTDPRTVLRFSR